MAYVPTENLLSLLDETSKPNVGGVLGFGSGDEAAYKASLSGQRAPIYGKGGFQGFGALEPYGQIFQLADASEVIDDGTMTDATDTGSVVGGGSDNTNNVVTTGGEKVTGTGTGINLSDIPIIGDLFDGQSGDEGGGGAKGQLSSQLPFDFGDVNIPGIGGVNITDAGTNLALDQIVGTAIDPLFGGLGIVSALVNPTFEDTSWGTPFNTGGGGLIGVLGQLSLNDLENAYAETEKGTEGYEFFAPGTIEGVDTPLAIKPGIFGFGEVVSGATNLLDQEKYDTNQDGIIQASELRAGAGMDAPAIDTVAEESFGSDLMRSLLDQNYNPEGTVISRALDNFSLVSPAEGSTLDNNTTSTFTTTGTTFADDAAASTSNVVETTADDSFSFSDLGTSISDAGSSFVDDFTSTVSDTASSVSSAVSDTFTGGGSDGVGNFGAVGDFFGGIGDALGITDYSGSSSDDSASSGSSNDDNDSGGGSSGGGGCFLTTAIVEQRGEADDGPTLTKLRNFRDTYMANIPEIVEEYYIVAPKIVASIPKDHSDWNWVGEQIDISVSHIDKGDLDSAFKTYKGMVERLKHEWL